MQDDLLKSSEAGTIRLVEGGVCCLAVLLRFRMVSSPTPHSYGLLAVPSEDGPIRAGDRSTRAAIPPNAASPSKRRNWQNWLLARGCEFCAHARQARSPHPLRPSTRHAG